DLDDDLADKLASVGLIASRQAIDQATQAATLGGFTDAYIAARVGVKRSGTISNLRMFADRLTDYFGKERQLGTIKRSDADDWALSLRQKYASATAGRTIRGAREFLAAAVRAEIVTRNPFDHLKTDSAPNKKRKRFIDRETIAQVLDACPNAEW